MFLVVVFLLENRDKRWQPKQRADTAQNVTDPERAVNAYNHPSEAEHRTKEQAHWDWQKRLEYSRDRFTRVTLGLTVFAVIATELTYCQTQRQADIAQRQLKIALDDQRPWVKLTIVPRSIVWHHNDALKQSFSGFIPELIVKNVGKRPATNVAVGVTSKGTGIFNTEEVQRLACSKTANGGQVVLFPNDETDASIVGIGEIGTAIIPPKAGRFPINIIGCVTYSGSNASEYYHTYFGYGLAHVIKRPDMIDGMDFTFGVDEDVAAESIRLMPWTNSSRAD